MEAEYSNENNSEEIETNKTFEIPNFILRTLPDDKVIVSKNCLMWKQISETFNVVYAEEKII